MSLENKELVRRIAKLVKLNKRLLEKNLTLTKEVELLREENNQYKKQLNIVSIEDRKKSGSYSNISKPIKFDTVTVLFAGIHGSPKENEAVGSHELIDDLEKVFYNFEDLVKKFNIINVKSIGDTYMCIGGIPEKNSTKSRIGKTSRLR